MENMLANTLKKEFKTTPGSDHGYGSRIWVSRYEDEGVLDILKRMSKWEGHDKSEGQYISYEFGEKRFAIVYEMLKELGYIHTGHW